jgi:hypothetical protein
MIEAILMSATCGQFHNLHKPGAKLDNSQRYSESMWLSKYKIFRLLSPVYASRQQGSTQQMHKFSVIHSCTVSGMFQQSKSYIQC